MREKGSKNGTGHDDDDDEMKKMARKVGLGKSGTWWNTEWNTEWNTLLRWNGVRRRGTRDEF